MCRATDSSMPLVCHAYPEQPLVTNDGGIEQELTRYVQKADMEKMERERKVQAMEFQEKLDKQWKMLAEIRNLVMLSLPTRKSKEISDDNDVFGSEITSSKSVVC